MLTTEYLGERFLTGTLQAQLDRYYQYDPSDFSNRYRHRQRIDFILRWLQATIVPAKTRVLDLGCGCGVYTVLSRQLGANVTSVDIDSQYQEPVRKWLAEAGQDPGPFVTSSGEGLPFGDAQFDLVIMSAVLAYVPEPTALIREIHRVLCGGGQVLISEENAVAFRAILMRLLGNPVVRSLRGLPPRDPIAYRRVTAWPFWRTRQICVVNGLSIVREGSANLLPTYNFKFLRRMHTNRPGFTTAWERINSCCAEAWPIRKFGSHYFVLAQKSKTV